MKNIIFSRRNLDFKIADLGLFSGILHLTWFYRAGLHMILTKYRGIQVRYPPLIRYWKVNFRSSDFHISYWEKISKNLADLQRGDPLQKAIRSSNYSEIWRRNFRNSYWKQIGRAAAS